jgi:hypothetical protein
MLSFLNDLPVISAFRRSLSFGLRSSVCVLLLATPVFAATTTTTLSVTSGGSAVTTITSGSVVTLTATVMSGATGVRTGLVDFCDATATYCTDVHLLGSAQLTDAGTAMLRFTPGVGSHSYKAVFVGTNNYPESASSAFALNVTALGAGTGPYPATTTITSGGIPGYYTLTATVFGAGASASPSPTGLVSFLDTSNGSSVMATAALSAGTAGISFTNSSNPGTGSLPQGEVASDFNGDGKADLAVANENDNTVTVLLGNGDGTFTAVASPSTGTSPIAMAVGDFNGDGRADLAVANAGNATNPGSSSVTVLLGNGDGTFSPAANLATGLNPISIAVGDFNGDGNADLAVVNYGGNTVTILLGNGDGTFSATALSPATGNIPYAIAVGDFNGDGKADLAVTNVGSSTVTVLLGNGDGTFTPASVSPTTGMNPYSITLGDFNGDGKVDMAIVLTIRNTSGPNNDAISVYLGNGDGTFSGSLLSYESNGGGANSIVSGDFNGDGQVDLALVEASDTLMLLGKGNGTFVAASSPPNGYTGGYVVSGDFNGDGTADLALADVTTNTVEVLLTEQTQTASATASNLSPVGTGTHQILASFPGDGSYSPSVSSTVGLTALPATTLTLGASPATGSSLGQTVILTATLSPPSVPQRTTAGESVAFYSDGGPLGNGNIGSGGVATFSTSSLPAGNHSLSATYFSDGDLGSSTSNTLSYAVSSTTLPSISFPVANHTYGDAPFSTSATSNSTGAISYSVVSGPATISGSTVTLTGAGTVVLQASQAATGSYSASTKTASITVNKVTLAIAATNTARVFGAANPTFTGTVNGGVNGDTFVETFSTAATAASMVGIYPIVPSVTGANLGDYTVTATNGTLTISQAGTATTFALSNQNLTLTATVAPLVSGVPTGSVSFYEGQTLVGTGILANGIASYAASSFPSGNVVVSAQYSGDANFTQSASPPILVLSVTPGSTSLTVAQAGSVMDTLSLSPIPGYTGTVQLSCSNLPQSATCSFQPSTLVFTGTNSSASASVTIQTGVSAQAAVVPLPGREKDRPALLAAMVWIPGLLLTLGRNRRKISSRIFLLMLLCGMAAGLTACGGSSAPGSGSTGKTPTGAYTVGIVAAGPSGLSQTTNLSLTVQ